jgi:hypothetical protein
VNLVIIKKAYGYNIEEDGEIRTHEDIGTYIAIGIAECINGINGVNDVLSEK